MAFFYVHYVLIYQTVTSLTYVFVPLDFRPLDLVKIGVLPLVTLIVSFYFPQNIKDKNSN